MIILFLGREILRLPLRVKFCISKNIAVISSEFRTGPCFYFFDFVRFYANLEFHARTFKQNFAAFIFRNERWEDVGTNEREREREREKKRK